MRSPWYMMPVLKQLSRNPRFREGCLFVSIGVLVAFGLQESLLFGLSRYDAGNVGVMNAIMRHTIDADLVISGSSRAMYHYDPQIIQSRTGLKTINIGRNGTKLHEQLRLLELYLERNTPPQYLIQNLDIFSLQENDDITDPKQYFAWLGTTEVYAPLVREKAYYRLYKAIPLFALAYGGGMREGVLGLLEAGRPSSGTLGGYEPQDRTWDGEFDKFREQHPGGVIARIDPKKEETLCRLLEICQRHRIVPLLVYSPEYHPAQSIFLNRPEIISAFRRIANQFNVRFWDYSNDPLSYEKANFYNSQHENEKGATEFSILIGTRMARELLREAAPRTSTATYTRRNAVTHCAIIPDASAVIVTGQN